MGIRRDAENVPGGDVVQMRRTGEELERLGCHVEFRLGDLGDLGGIDLVHVFNTTRIDDTYRMVRQAQAAKCPVVVSTIWHSMREMARAYGAIYGWRPFPIWTYTALKEIHYARRAGQAWSVGTALSYRERLAHVLSTADALLPNSRAELAALEEETGCRPRRAWVIPNGYDQRAAVPMDPWPSRREVICAGRIEPRKNQHGVARALRRARLPQEAQAFFYGATMAQSAGYRKKLERYLVAGRSAYGGSLPQEELFKRYGRARVTVLASFFETTGLSALEGLAYGSAVVITDSPCTREYFGDFVNYCDPYSDESVAAAIERAWHNPPADAAELLRRFTWQEAGRLTLEAYGHVLKS